MIVLQIVAIVFAVIILLVGFVMLMPVKVVFELLDSNDVKVYFKFLFFTFGNKQKKKSKVADTLSGATGVAKKEKKAKNKRDIKEIIDIVVNLAKQVADLVKHCKLEKLNIVYISGGEDAGEIAVNYGIACSVIYPVSGVLQSIMQVNNDGLSLDVRCDFQSEDTLFSLKTVISVKVVHLLVAIVKFMKEQVKK